MKLMKENRFSKLRQWFRNNFVFFGPGLLLAITAAGEAGVTEAIEIGAHYGLALIWVIIITLIFKYAFTNGIARYTLATGNTIFDALHNLPGPKNWGSILLIASFLMETLSMGAMLMFAATFLDYLLPGVYVLVLLAALLAALVLLLLRTEIYESFEIVMAGLIAVLVVGIIYSLLDFPLSGSVLLSGLVPTIPHGSEMAILAIIGVVGSGLNLMLYSVWLKAKSESHDDSGEVCSLHNEAFFKKYIRSVNVDIIAGFSLVAVITIGFMFLGYVGYAVSFMPHGAAITLDTIITQVTYIFNTIPFGQYIFLIFVALIFFGAVIVGMDARATAVATVVHHIFSDSGRRIPSEKMLYYAALIVFTGVVIISFTITNPMLVIRQIAVISAILFGIYGFITIYLDMRLPSYARGGRFWILVMAVGSVLSIYIALLIQGSFLEFGIPLIERMLVVIVALMVFLKSNMFKRLTEGTATVSDKVWTIFLFGLLSIYGIYRGVSVTDSLYGITFNFADIGPMIAGFLGGPVLGIFAGVFGFAYRMMQGGVTVFSGSLAIVVAGAAAGFAIRYWKGRLTVFRAVVLAILIECFNILWMVPTFGLAIGNITLKQITDIVMVTILPQMIVNVVGVALFAYLVRKVDVFRTAVQVKGVRGTLKEIADMIKAKGAQR
ncbi:MAG: Nramp family divalent metal transporter [Methanocorpusculum sp.]|nr:Nramp family divalent metal transporter [Methanocorpusculum sp.]